MSIESMTETPDVAPAGASPSTSTPPLPLPPGGALALDAAADVLQTTAEAVGGAKDALLVDEGIAQLNSDGDNMTLRVTGMVQAALQIGGKAQLGGRLDVTQVGDGPDATYEVKVEKHALAALKLEVAQPLSEFASPYGEAGGQTTDSVIMSFDTPEQAARAAKLVQRLAVADGITDPLAATPLPTPGLSGGPNPLANPLTDMGAPPTIVQHAVGVDANDMAFLQNNITGFEQSFAAVGVGALEVMPPQLAPGFELALEGRLTGKAILTRRIDLPTETEAGSLSYKIAGQTSLSLAEQVTLDPLPSNQLVAGVTALNLLNLGSTEMSVTGTWDIPANTDITTSPIYGTALPEVDVIAAGNFMPDQLKTEITADWRDQGPTDMTRGDGYKSRVTTTIDNPENVVDALGSLLTGDPRAAAQQLGTTVEGEVQRVERSGFNLLTGVKLQVGQGNIIAGYVFTEGGVDDIVGTRKITIGEQAAAPAPANDPNPPQTPQSEPTPEVLVVTPRNGLTLRDAPGGDRTSVFQNGTFLQATGNAVTDDAGNQWIPVTGTDVNDARVTGYVSAQYVADHPTGRGQMDDHGRIDPRLEADGHDKFRVTQDDNLWDIAKARGLDFEELVALNDDHLISPDLIFAGDTIYLPTKTPVAEPPAPAPAPVEAEPVEDRATSQPADESIQTETTGTLSPPEEPSTSPSISAAPTQPSAPSPNVDSAPSIPTVDDSQPSARSNAPSAPSAPLIGDSTPDISPDPYTGPGGASPAPVADNVAPVAPEPVQNPASDRSVPDNYLTDYQVADDEVVSWRPKAFGVETPGWAEGAVRKVGELVEDADVFGTGEHGRRLQELAQDHDSFDMDFTKAEAAALDELGPLDLTTWFGITQSTGGDALTAIPRPVGNTMDNGEWNNDGHVDAYRHTLWNARLTSELGEDWTARYATAHEALPGNPAAREAMDLHNNEIGRRIARDNPDADDAQLQALVKQALDNGDLVVVNQAGNLAWSDQVDVGAHGQSARGDLPGNPDFDNQAPNDES